MLTKMRHALDSRRARPDDGYAFVRQVGQPAGCVAAGVLVVPTASMESVTLEVLDTGNRRQLGPIERATRHDHEAGAKNVPSIGLNGPSRSLVVPACLFDLGLKTSA